MTDLLAIGYDPDAEAPTPRTAEEIVELKRQWQADGDWDIEETEGFEYHYQELRQWREAQEAEWQAKEARRLNARAELLGFTSKQLEFIERLESQIKMLQSNFDRHLNAE